MYIYTYIYICIYNETRVCCVCVMTRHKKQKQKQKDTQKQRKSTRHLHGIFIYVYHHTTHTLFFYFSLSIYVSYHASHNYIPDVHEHTQAHILSHPMVGTTVFSVADLAVTIYIYACVLPLMQFLLLPLPPRPRHLRPPRRPRPQVVHVSLLVQHIDVLGL